MNTELEGGIRLDSLDFSIEVEQPYKQHSLKTTTFPLELNAPQSLFEYQHCFANPVAGGAGKLREVYKEYLRVWGMSEFSEEDVEGITQATFDKTKWAEKKEEERIAYQEKLERRIRAIKIVDDWLEGKKDFKLK